MAVKKNSIGIHPYLFEENNNSFKLMEMNVSNCLRAMLWQDEIFFPPNQHNEPFKNMVTKTLQQLSLQTTYELFFMDSDAGFQLINISKSPSLSLYGLPFLQYLSGTLNTVQTCY